MNFTLTKEECEQIRLALAEDLGEGDLSSRATIRASETGLGRFRAGERLVLAGLPYAQAVFQELDDTLHFPELLKDGAFMEAGEVAAVVSGDLRSLLAGERLALNFLQRLSGIATLTSRYVEAVAGLSTKITDTRKTTPLWRRAEKYAVRLGGGVNHRMGLYDTMLIKDNHIDACPSLEEAVRRARAHAGDAPVIVEIRRPEEVEIAIAAGATRLLLDNMGTEDLARCVDLAAGDARTEASGGVRLPRVRQIAETGVDFISVGALTHSAPASDLNFKIEAESRA